jgi:hypothetical protein
MRIFGSLQLLDYEAEEHTEAIRQALLAHFKKAARAFVRAAVPLIPVQTGMARGSFLNIGLFLNVAVPINPTQFNKFYYPPEGGRLPKNAAIGANLTTAPRDMIKITSENRITFEIQSRVFHLTLEDIIGVRSGPWHSFEAGRIAFMNVLRTFRAPSVKAFVNRTSITFGRGANIRSAPIRLKKQETIRNG